MGTCPMDAAQCATTASMCERLAPGHGRLSVMGLGFRDTSKALVESDQAAETSSRNTMWSGWLAWAS